MFSLGTVEESIRPGRTWVRLNRNTGGAVTGFPKNFPEDSLGSGAHNKTNCNRRNNADVGGPRVTGQSEKRRCATSGRKFGRCPQDVSVSMVSASRCARFGWSRWIEEGEGYLTPQKKGRPHTRSGKSSTEKHRSGTMTWAILRVYNFYLETEN